MKKAELSMTFLIVTVLGILVLVLVSYLVVSGFGDLRTSTACAQTGGVCVEECNAEFELGENPEALCAGANQATAGGQGTVCCQVGRGSSADDNV